MFYQVEDPTCAPIALMNLASWCGKLIDFRATVALCKTDHEGTYDQDMRSGVHTLSRGLGCSYRWCKQIHLKEFHEYMSGKDSAALVGHLDCELEYHWSFWRGPQPEGYMIDNFKVNVPDKILKRDYADRLLTEGSERKVILIDHPNHKRSTHADIRLPAEHTQVGADGVLHLNLSESWWKP